MRTISTWKRMTPTLTRISNNKMMRMQSWEIQRGRVLGPAPFLIAGIVNVTPDSFFDGGEHFGPDKGIGHARELLAHGAEILDIGGESTRPGAENVPAERELDRVLPVVEAVCRELKDIGSKSVVSVDTYKAEVAARSIEAGPGL